MAADLSIRNLTIHPLELIAVERFDSERVQTGNVVKNVTKTITGFLNATQHISHRTVAKEGKAREPRQDVSVRVEPFRLAAGTGVRAPEKGSDKGGEVLRLRFRYEGRVYETDAPSPSSRSAVLRKVEGQGDGHELTAVYVPRANPPVLAVYSSARLEAWMRELDDAYPLSVLSLPGTHNSPTCHTALPSVRCQSASVREQLDNGVRYLDVRVSVNPDTEGMALVHAAFPVSLTGTKWLADMLSDVYDFLARNPSESVIMCLKREGTGKGTDQDLGNLLEKHYVAKERARWWTESRIPRLGEARGRVVLVRRFRVDDALGKGGYGLDASTWPDNCEDGHVHGDNIRVQDFYEITESENIEKKIGFACGHLEKAAEQRLTLDQSARPPPFFVNFLSASNFFDARCWPERIAAKVNPAIIEYLCASHGEEGKGPRKLKVGSGQTGVVVTDWVGANGDWDLIRCIVGMNARLERKK